MLQVLLILLFLINISIFIPLLNFRFNLRCMSPAIVPIHYALTYMIQSGKYMLSPDFTTYFRKIDKGEADSIWEMIHNSTGVQVEQVLKVVFDPRSYDSRLSNRYFVKGSKATPTSLFWGNQSAVIATPPIIGLSAASSSSCSSYSFPTNNNSTNATTTTTTTTTTFCATQNLFPALNNNIMFHLVVRLLD